MAYRVVDGKSSGRRKKTDPSVAGAILKKALSRYGLDEKIERYQFVLYWKEIVGADIARRTVPESFTKGVLVVRVVNSAWAQELTFQKDTILRKMREYLGADTTINEIVFKIGAA